MTIANVPTRAYRGYFYSLIETGVFNLDDVIRDTGLGENQIRLWLAHCLKVKEARMPVTEELETIENGEY